MTPQSFGHFLFIVMVVALGITTIEANRLKHLDT